MAHVIADRVLDTAVTTGTGDFSVSGSAPTGFRTLSAVLTAADTFYYAIVHQTANEWETGLGTFSGSNTFVRTTVLSSSNSNNAVSFSAGTKDVFLTAPAARDNPRLSGLTDNRIVRTDGTAGNIQQGTLGEDDSGNITNVQDNTGLLDSNGNELALFGVTASAVNEVKISNAATGGDPTIAAQGGDTDVSLLLDAKGAGFIKINDDLDANGKFIRMDDATGIKDDSGNEQLIFQKTASAVNEWEMTNAATGNKPVLAVTGGDTDIIARINGKGTGGVEIEGTATNDNATAGYVGQVVESSIVVGSAVSLTTATAANVTSISLTAGDWEVEGVVQTAGSGGPTTTALLGWINTVSATIPADLGATGGFFQWRGSTTSNTGYSTGSKRISLASTTTVYLGAQATFTGGSSLAAYGYVRARRMR